jgi:L-ascorbate metabolism protein UlaG (beta-lactamase superfamily)
VGGDPDIVDCSRTAAGIRFKTITVPHDCHDGSYMGLSRMIQFSVDGVRVLHPGDLGRLPNDAELEALGRIDLLFLPIGGKYTIGVDAAITLYRQLRPRWAVPMHYRSDCVDLDMAARDDFVQALNSDDRVHEVGGPQWVCSAADRLEPSEILLLDPARGPFSL